ncbi:MAG: hypothetical protein FI702_07670, partial [SAR202 cluster bacterium]|nr:hypothetical protein [SAR202 cluster bacterium]
SGNLVPYASVHRQGPRADGAGPVELRYRFQLRPRRRPRVAAGSLDMIPLHFLNPGMEIPVMPLYVNGFAAPLPNAPRCFSLGQMIRGFVEQWGGNERIAIIASGAFAQDVGCPLRGWIDEE